MKPVVEILTAMACNAACLVVLYFGRYMATSEESGGWKSMLPSDDKVINCLAVIGEVFVQVIFLWKAISGETDAMTAAMFIVLAVWLFYIALVDLKKKIIPNSMLVGMLAARLILWIWKFIRDGMPQGGQILYQIVYSVLLVLALLFVVMIAKGGFGYGDVKLLVVIGLFLDYGYLLSILLTALLGALAVSAYLLLVKKCDGKTTIPFGPFFYLGYIINALIML